MPAHPLRTWIKRLANKFYGAVKRSYRQMRSGSGHDNAGRKIHLTLETLEDRWVPAPVITSSYAPLANNASTLIITGSGFDPSGTNTVTFNDGVYGFNGAVTTTSLTVNVYGLNSVAVGTSLTASVTVDGTSSGSAVQVATIAPDSSTGDLFPNATSLTITGYGFDTTASHDTVSFSNGVTGTVGTASP